MTKRINLIVHVSGKRLEDPSVHGLSLRPIFGLSFRPCGSTGNAVIVITMFSAN